MPLFTRYQSNSLRTLPLLSTTDLPSVFGVYVSLKHLEIKTTFHSSKPNIRISKTITAQKSSCATWWSCYISKRVTTHSTCLTERILCSSVDTEVASFVMCRIEYLVRLLYSQITLLAQTGV